MKKEPQVSIQLTTSSTQTLANCHLSGIKEASGMFSDSVITTKNIDGKTYRVKRRAAH